MRILLLFYLFVLSIFDWRKKRVPVSLLVGGLIIAVLAGFYHCRNISGDLAGAIAMLCLGIIPGGFLLLLAWLTRKIGWGDGMALAVVGLLRGFRECLALLCLSMLLMALVCMALLLFRRVRRNTILPYLPFLACAYLAGFF